MKRLFLFLLLFSMIQCVFADVCIDNVKIIQTPLLFNAERIQLTQLYRQQHYGIQAKDITFVPRMIILHWTAYATLKESFAELYPPTLTDRPELVKEGKLNTSAHYLVDRDGTIYQLMPSNWMARHVIGLNNIAIGIENVGGDNGVEDLTDAQLKSNLALIKMLTCQYPTIQYLIGHYEYGAFRNTPLSLEKDKNYFTQKIDPGPKFMHAVRKQLQHDNIQLQSEFKS